MTNHLHAEPGQTQHDSSELELASAVQHDDPDAYDEDDRPTLTFIDAAKLNDEQVARTPPS